LSDKPEWPAKVQTEEVTGLKIEPKPHPNGKGYIVNLRHPLFGRKSLYFGLGTTDEIIAGDICRDARIIFDNPDILQAPTPEKLVGFSR
jgi:hypothetical protein